MNEKYVFLKVRLVGINVSEIHKRNLWAFQM